MKLDYISQSTDPSDRRRLILNLTPSGQQTVSELLPKVQERFSSWMMAFGKENAKQMLFLMNESDKKSWRKKIKRVGQVERLDLFYVKAPVWYSTLELKRAVLSNFFQLVLSAKQSTLSLIRLISLSFRSVPA